MIHYCRLAAALALLAPAAVSAQSYPAKSVRWISPFAPGGGADVTSRAIAQKLTETWGQQVVVDNRGGAGGNIGVELGAKAAPDGYTITLGTIGPMAINVSLFAKLPYDPVKDFIAITQAADTLNALVVHPSLPVKNVREFIALARKRPGELNFGSSGPGATDHLAGELFNLLAGVKMVHVPYKGGAPAMLDLMAGNVQLVFATIATSLGQIQAGKIRVLGMAGTRRFELLPEVPTVAEAGLRGFEVNNWYGVYVPTGTPKEVVSKIHTDVVKALQTSEVKKRLLDSGIIAVWSTPEQFAAFQQAETRKWAKVIKDANIKVE
jgi:tripartite-type tricarboxylate transporter receptor subunit TctC